MLKDDKARKAISEAMTIRLDEAELLGLVNESVLIGSSSIVGTRNNQQDSYYVYKSETENCAIAIICDGMGGLSDGAVASKTAVEYISQQLKDVINAQDLKQEFFRITNDANNKILNLESRAGTTMVMVVVKDGLLHWASVGDSKIYVFKGGRLHCLTNEHNYSFMAEQKRNDSNFRFNPNVRQDALVSYLGAENPEYIDVHPAPLKLADGDVILLCSDGLYKTLNEEQIVEKLLLDDMSMDEVASMLTSDALSSSKGSQDNTTTVVLKYKNEIK